MKRLRLAAVLSVVLLVSLALETAADSYRCGRKLVRTGDSSADVLALCGKPGHRDRGQENILLQGARRKVSVERWYYRKNSRSLQHIVMLHHGRVVAISVAGR